MRLVRRLVFLILLVGLFSGCEEMEDIAGLFQLPT